MVIVGKPRLLVLCHTGLFSGAEVVLERIIGAATRAGWRVTVLVPPGRAGPRFEAAGAEIRGGPDLKLPYGSKILGLVNRSLLSIAAARLLRREAKGADLVLVNSIHALPALAIARLRVPSVWLLHQVIISRFRLQLVRITRRAGFSTIAVSEAAAAPVRKLGLDVRVVPNGTPCPVPIRPDEPTDPPVVGCAAALTKWKGQDVLLEAAALLDRGITVELLGERFPKDAHYEHALRRRAEQPDLAGRVQFLGFRDDVLDVMRSWSVAVSASVDPEAVGLTTIEAMSVGTPVVGTDIGATTTIVGDAGLLVRPGDPHEMSRAIRRLLEDSDLWLKCHRSGPEIVEQHFSLGGQLQLMLVTLAKLAGVGASSTDPTTTRP